MTITYTPLTAAHLAALAELDRTAPDPWSEAEIAAELQKPHTHCTVAVVEGKPVGFACFWLNDTLADLATVTVEQSRREQGIGGALLRQCLARLTKAGAKRVLLEVRESNAPAIALYQKLGFKTLAKRNNLYTHPAENGLLMELVLPGRD